MNRACSSIPTSPTSPVEALANLSWLILYELTPPIASNFPRCKMAEGYSLVKTVVQMLNDGEKGFADIGEKLKSPELKAFFMKESTHRGAFAKEFEAELALAAGDKKDIGETATGAVHRVWGDLKASLGGSDHTLLETAEQGEDFAKKAYKEALEAQDLPSTKDSRASLDSANSHSDLTRHRESIPGQYSSVIELERIC